MKPLFILFCLFLIIESTKAQIDSIEIDTIPKKLTMLFAGDIMGHGPQFRAAWDSVNDTFNYSPCFKYIKPFIESVDVAVANLEVNFGGKPYTGYPTFSSPDEMAREIQKTGFDVLGMANNHCYDKGKQGFERTIALLDSLKITHLGTYTDVSARDSTYPLIVNKNGLRIALFNYTYSTNGIKPDTPSFINYIRKEQIRKDIAKADSAGVDFKIMFIHWGLEYELIPNNDQKQLAKYFANLGFDVIVGSHPHVVQTFELLHPDSADSAKVVPVFYSLGNFISNQRDRYRDGGAVFYLEVEKRNNNKFLKYNYLPYWVYKGDLHGKYQYYVIPVSQYSCNPNEFALPEEDNRKLLEFSNDVKMQFPNLQANEFYNCK
jgi:poly-gamma-glutamate capsule biosynthesis protein CapA/YwtB (metallophosphatase superfamily)